MSQREERSVSQHFGNCESLSRCAPALDGGVRDGSAAVEGIRNQGN
jgi:hypothetical protein